MAEVSKLPEVKLVIGSVLEGSMRHLEAARKDNRKEKNASLKLQLRHNCIAVILMVLLRERERLSYILVNTTYVCGDVSNHDIVLCDQIVVMLAQPPVCALPSSYMTTTPSSQHGG
jgi:hypothetical protein